MLCSHYKGSYPWPEADSEWKLQERAAHYAGLLQGCLVRNVSDCGKNKLEAAPGLETFNLHGRSSHSFVSDLTACDSGRIPQNALTWQTELPPTEVIIGVGEYLTSITLRGPLWGD